MRALGRLATVRAPEERASAVTLRHQVVVHDHRSGARCVGPAPIAHHSQHPVLADHRGHRRSSQRQCPPTLRTPATVRQSDSAPLNRSLPNDGPPRFHPPETLLPVDADELASSSPRRSMFDTLASTAMGVLVVDREHRHRLDQRGLPAVLAGRLEREESATSWAGASKRWWPKHLGWRR